jgi:hypothetical protein
MKEFIKWIKSTDGILSTIGALLIGVGFGWKIGLGIIGIILYHNIMARVR